MEQEEDRDVTSSSIIGIFTGKVVDNGINHSHYTGNSASITLNSVNGDRVKVKSSSCGSIDNFCP